METAPDPDDLVIELDAQKFLQSLDQVQTLLGSLFARLELIRAHNALATLHNDLRPASLSVALEGRSDGLLLGRQSADWATQERNHCRELDQKRANNQKRARSQAYQAQRDGPSISRGGDGGSWRGRGGSEPRGNKRHSFRGQRCGFGGNRRGRQF